jgi:Zn-dependent protease
MLSGFDLSWIITYVILLLFAFPVHEFAHAAVATYFGDETPRMAGRLTLNPLAHLDLMGSLMLLIARFGWAKPVPVNPYTLRRRSPSALMWVSLAGPMSNFLLAVLASILVRLLAALGGGGLTASLLYIENILFIFIQINLVLMLFNLIPIAPLDGEKILSYFLPPAWADALDRIQPYGPIILLAVLFLIPSLLHIDLIGMLIRPPLQALFSLLVG